MVVENNKDLVTAIVDAVCERIAEERPVPPKVRCLTDEEQAWVRLAIERQSQSIAFRKAVIEKSVLALAGSGIVWVATLLVEFTKAHWK